MEFLFIALGGLATQAPLIIAWIVGLALCVQNWERHPKQARATTAALIGFLLLLILNSLANAWIPRMITGSSLGSSQMTMIFAARGIAVSLISAGLWGIILWAIFSGREER